MNSMDALRFLTLSFLDSCETYLDEDTYDSAKLVIEKTPADKLLKKVKKFLAPLREITEKETFTKRDFIELGFFKSDVEISDEEVESLGQQAKMCLTVVTTLSEIDPGTLSQIEGLAHTLQLGLQDEFEKLPEDAKTGVNPTEVLGSLFKSLQNTVSDEGGFNGLQKGENVTQEGLNGVLQNIIPNVMTALQQPLQHESVDERKRNLLEMYEQIDGNTKRE